MIWVIGNKGMLGTELCEVLKNKEKLPFVSTDLDVDITNQKALDDFAENMAKKNTPITCIINCAAYTNVNKAESDKDFCHLLNVEGPANIARTAKKIGAVLIHISTDYVFDGKSNFPYTEDMKINPTGVYGTTKAQGEEALKKQTDEFFIIRTAWLYGIYGNNFVKTMLRILEEKSSAKVVQDQFGTPTYALDLSNAIAFFARKIENNEKNAVPFGIYHFTNLGKTNWFEFASKICEEGIKNGLITHEAAVFPCTTEEYPTPAPRPAYSVLSKDKIAKILDFKIPEWQESLNHYLEREKQSKNC